MIFSAEEAGRLRTKIGQVSQDTNRLYLQFRGQAGSWSGLPLGSYLLQAQVLINELTTEAEKLEDLIRIAVQGVQKVQEENKRQADQLTQQFTALGGLLSRLGGSPITGRAAFPASALTAVMKLITSVATISGKDELSRDPAMQKLEVTLKASTFGSIDWFTAQLKLTGICEARNQIAKAQTAYSVYQAFGNKAQMAAVHQSAEEARKKLISLGVNKLLAEPGKDWSSCFRQPAVKACEYDPSVTAASIPLLQDESYLLLLRMAMEPGIQGQWAKSQLPAKRLEVQLAEAAKIAEAQAAAEQQLAGPPVKLPDGTVITAKNKENETTLAYFMDKIYDPDAQLTPMYTMYLGWLEDTYGMTAWRKKVVQADAVAVAFTESLLKETVMGAVDTAKFAFRLVVDPEQTTQEVLDQANYLISHPEVLVEAAKTVYHNFEEGTPEERAAMLGATASVLLPGVSVTKSGKLGQVMDGVQGLAYKALAGVKDLGKVLQNSEKFPGLNPFLTTPEGFTFSAGKHIPDTDPLLKNPVQEHRLSEMDGLGDGKAGKIEGAGEVGKYDTKIKWGINDINARPYGKGFFGERIPQSNPRVDGYELKINPNNESYYLPHPNGGYVQFENLVVDVLQDGKLIMKPKSFYHVDDLPEFAKAKVLQEALRQQVSALAAGYKVEWLVSDAEAVEQLTNLFGSKNIDIVVRYFPE
ncbi:hypothetical protein [Paenibacillus sp. MMS20-IR301]|uniref:hypothetical protein n=1 Tax=Paenibacillus sp. MMS20-IR301 TaxID=2895946 RepID=UPI0028ED10E3|nr:hypothetical protein [Paenibacillus sp. MMS20-IR301]WNS43702.1 hypothetical protein LOS79_00060 [Paenibacillus sp. MMS20-IR301]